MRPKPRPRPTVQTSVRMGSRVTGQAVLQARETGASCRGPTGPREGSRRPCPPQVWGGGSPATHFFQGRERRGRHSSDLAPGWATLRASRAPLIRSSQRRAEGGTPSAPLHTWQTESQRGGATCPSVQSERMMKQSPSRAAWPRARGRRGVLVELGPLVETPCARQQEDSIAFQAA